MGFLTFFRERHRQKIIARHPIPAGLWSDVWKNHVVFHRLNREEEQRLREMATVFLYEKKFMPLGGIVIDDSMEVVVAAQAVLPVLNLGLDWLNDFETICLQPQAYRDAVRRRNGALMTEYLGPLGGEVTVYGSIILSWRDVESSGKGSGYNVVIHEITHKLDRTNLAMDGCPYLTPEQDPARWKRVFTEAYRDLESRLERNPPLDPYAAESPAEFFAVASEEFFERPALLQYHYRDVFDELVTFFRQDPLKGNRTEAWNRDGLVV